MKEEKVESLFSILGKSRSDSFTGIAPFFYLFLILSRLKDFRNILERSV